MKTKIFKEYLETRLDKDEIAEIEAQARLEIEILQSIQSAISNKVKQKSKS